MTAKNIIAHNIAFDLKVLRKLGILTDHNRLYCTMVADHLLDEEREHGLKKLARSILGKEDTLSYEEAYAKGGEAFIDYCINDVVWAWDLCMWQQNKLRDQGLVEVFRNIEMPFQQCIVDMEVNGFLIDLKKAEETTKVLLEAKEKFTVEMLEYLGERFLLQQKLDGTVEIVSPINFESPSQLSSICEKRLGLKKVEETDSGAYSIGKTFLKHYESHDFVKILSKYKIASQLYKLFFKPLPEFVCGDGRVRSQFKDIGTKTGRLSCSNPNLQQLAKPNDKFPIETRACFIVPEGRMMITADYSGQEVAVMAEISRDETLVKALNNGYDMHLAVANSFYELGIPEEALSKKHPDFKKYKEKYDDIRSKAKTITFGLCYGKGAFGFSKDFGISEDEAQKLVE
jgi:DNA polymerase-1